MRRETEAQRGKIDQGHSASQWQGWSLHPGLWTPAQGPVLGWSGQHRASFWLCVTSLVLFVENIPESALSWAGLGWADLCWALGQGCLVEPSL